MAGVKISQLVSGGAITSQDEFPIARAGVETYKLAASQIVTDGANVGVGSGQLYFGKTTVGSTSLQFRSLSGIDGLSVVNQGNTLVISASGQNPVKTSITGNGSTTTYVVNGASSINANNYRVDIDGVLQEPINDYTIVGSNIVFTSAPPNGSKVTVVSNNLVRAYDIIPSDGSVTDIKIANNASISPSKLAGQGYVYVQTLYYTVTGTTTFTKATYPWLRAIKVRVQGGGGGGGFAQIGGRVGAGGGAGGYGEKFLLASTLLANETITVGAGGEGGNPTLSAVDSANGGLTSSFGSYIICTGGGGGGSMTSAGDNKNARRPGGPGGTSTGGDINIAGQTGNDSSRLIVTSPTVIPFPTSGGGGNSMFGFGGSSVRDSLEFGIAIAGRNGTGYGSGGSGGCGHGASANAKGGDGANGIVIIDLYS